MTHSFPTRRSSELRAAARTWAAGTDHLILCASRGGSYNGAVSKGGKGLQARSEGPFMSLTRISVGLAMAVALASCGGGKERPKADIAASRVTTIGVNAYLWRAALDTIS